MNMKQLCAKEALKYIKDDMCIGLGGGSTVGYLAEYLAKEGKRVTVVTPSDDTAELCKNLGLIVLSLEMVEYIDIAFDGCDELDRCLKARDDSLRNKKYEQAFSYMRRLCENFKNADACLQTYSTYNAIQSNTEKNRSLVRVTLYEVLYYLDIGCKLNNYDACMRAGKIYEHGVKPGTSQALYGYNIAYDAQEAKRYYKRVCRSISDKAEKACKKLEELSQTRHSLTK